ncbi:MAG: hypothetical protein KDC45_04585 [Bacteroidetes bacterium]|nr:hypothetical protein [Bacteroidota bacterium]
MRKKFEITSEVKPPAERAEPEPLQWVDRGWYVVLEFELANSARMDQVLEKAKTNPHFVELIDERGVTMYRTIYFKNDFPRFADLYELVGSWKNSRLFYRGDEVRKEHFDLWYQSYKIYWGHRKTLNSGDYCGLGKMSPYPDFLGCYERCVELRWRDPLFTHYQLNSRVWYSFGKKTKEVFTVDKPAMISYLSGLNEDYHACPCYGHTVIEHVLNQLPNEINPLIHKEWQFKGEYLKHTADRSYFNFDIAMTTLPDICPVSEKAYHKFMQKILQ